LERRIKMSDSIIHFLRLKDYKQIKELGQGACGKTILLYDETISEHFVCKKFVPYSDNEKVELFEAFTREIKLLHLVYHENIVRVFNYYLYPEQFAGFILMEYVEGKDIETYISENPDRINELFIQAVNGFSHLEVNNILHRDIRPYNILVNNLGALKIIDFGFGKRIATSKDFNKSVTLNWWCEKPAEFNTQQYDFSTEVYFVGKLFQGLIAANSIESFAYSDTLLQMCMHNSQDRIKSFSDVLRKIQSNKFMEIGFSEEEKETYRFFANSVSQTISKIEGTTTYNSEIEKIQLGLENAYRACMLEDWIPDSSTVIRCLLNGSYYYNKSSFSVESLKGFIHLLKSSSYDKKKIIISNLQTRLNAIKRYTAQEENLPF
jgi:serine/threonine protein kinase